MNPYITGALVGLLVLINKKNYGNANRILLNEEDFSIKIADLDALKKAKKDTSRRFKNLKDVSTVGVNSKQYRFAIEEWLTKNPDIKYGSDLLFVKDLDSFGEVILYNTLNIKASNKSLSALHKNSDKILHLISDLNYLYNIPIASIPSTVKKIKLNKTQQNKLKMLKEKAIPKLTGIAPYGNISFLESYNVPYSLTPLQIKSVNLWKQAQN